MCALCILFFSMSGVSHAAGAARLTRESKTELNKLYKNTPAARALGEKAHGILVFPSVKKGGFVVGGQYGEGVLFKNGKATGYYNMVSASMGLQAGAQKFGFALFFMSDKALRYLNKSGGWELGTDPNIVVVNKGAAGEISTTNVQSDIYAFFFDQKGLMAGISLQGTKVTRIRK